MIFKIISVHMVLAFCFGIGHTKMPLDEDVWCTNLNSSGICTLEPNCPYAAQSVKLNGYHDLTRCGFKGFVEIVCCPTPTDEMKTRKCIQVCKNYEKQFIEMIKYSSTTEHYQGGNRPIIAHGTPVEADKYPHVAALGFYNDERKEYTFNCGGTLISDKYVITAAHCIANIDGDKLEVIRMGTIDVPTEPQTAVNNSFENSLDHISFDHTVKRIILHPEYSRSRSINDIALVELEEEVQFYSSRRPACLYTKDEEPSKMQIAGWGATDIEGTRLKTLQMANVFSVPIQKCAAKFGSGRRRIGSTQICAQDVKSDTCPGDSGGPLQVEDINGIFRLVGITSFGSPCFGGLSGVYTKVFKYLDWIEEIVWP